MIHGMIDLTLKDCKNILLWHECFKKQNTPTQADIDIEKTRPKLATPRKLVPGGYNPYVGSTVDPLAMISPYPKFSTKQVVEEFRKAFEDEGDVPRYKALDTAPGKGTIVYDKNGDSYSGWDPSKDFGLELSLIHI